MSPRTRYSNQRQRVNMNKKRPGLNNKKASIQTKNKKNSFSKSNSNFQQQQNYRFKSNQRNYHFNATRQPQLQQQQAVQPFQQNGPLLPTPPQFVNQMAAAVTLANILRSELTINLTKDEPRLVIFNSSNEPKFSLNNSTNLPPQQQVHNSNHFNRQLNRSQPVNIVNHKFNNNNHHHHHYQHQNFLNKGFSSHINNGLAAGTSLPNAFTGGFKPPQQQQQSRYPLNRFKYVKPVAGVDPKKDAPYNTTQYIMYDYSKRAPLKDQVCPNEQQQFIDDWNMALAAEDNLNNQNSGPKKHFERHLSDQSQGIQLKDNLFTIKLLSQSDNGLMSTNDENMNTEPVNCADDNSKQPQLSSSL